MVFFWVLWIIPYDAVDGGWSPWIMASNCSVLCGGGVQLFVRKCNNPVPANGGKDCEGPKSKNETCAYCPCTLVFSTFICVTIPKHVTTRHVHVTRQRNSAIMQHLMRKSTPFVPKNRSQTKWDISAQRTDLESRMFYATSAYVGI